VNQGLKNTNADNSAGLTGYSLVVHFGQGLEWHTGEVRLYIFVSFPGADKGRHREAYKNKSCRKRVEWKARLPA